MSYIDDETIRAIRNKHPIKDVVEHYISLTKKGEDYWGLCPFHNDSNASLSVSSKLDMFQCFACKKAGNVFNFISLMEHISYGDAIRKLALEDGLDVGYSIRESRNMKEYEIMSLAIKYYQNNINSSLGDSAREYLAKRDIDLDTIRNFEIGLSISKYSLTDFLRNKYEVNSLIDLGLTNSDGKDVFYDRIMIPIHDLNGNPIGFGGRIYHTKDSSKYVNTRATKLFDKSRILFNYHRAHTKLEKNNSIIIMEGYFDVIRAYTVGVYNCVAPMGTSLTKNHVDILKRVTKSVILCFDGDKAGRDATERAIPLLVDAGMDVKIIRLEEKDPDEFIIKRGRDAFLDKVEHPISVIDFKMSLLKEEKNLNDISDVRIYLDNIMRELVYEKDDILIELTLKKLASQFGLEYDTLKKRYDNYRRHTKIKKDSNDTIKKEKKVSNKYGQATNNLLYYMIVSSDVTYYCEKSVSMIMDEKKRRLFNEIIYYYHKYGELVIADFINYLETKTDVADTFQEIITLNLKKDYTFLEIDDYIKCVNEFYKKSVIDKLKFDLSQEDDPMKQANILKEIMKIRGVKTSD